MSTSYVRVRPHVEGGPCAVRHPEHGEYVVPDPARPYRTDDPLVEAYPWLFRTDAELAGEAVETTRKAPGESRPAVARKRPAK